MTSLRGRVLAAAALLGAALFSAWALQGMKASQVRPAEGSRHAPDFYMEQFATTTMGLDGRPRRRVEADYFAHFPDTDTNELTRPYLVMFRPDAEPWHVRSERGWVSASGDVMLLLGKVHIWRNDAQGERRLDIHTSDVRVLPDSDYGETDQPVVITSPNSESRGVGMRAYLEHSRLELLSQVRTVYDKASN